jgi:hypothetical protein
VRFTDVNPRIAKRPPPKRPRYLKLKPSPAPFEKYEQEAFFAWLRHTRSLTFEGERIFDYAYSIPNGAYLAGDADAAGHSQVKQGLKSGVPDLCIAIPVGAWHGLYIEMKRIGAPKPAKNQTLWRERLTKQGYCALTCVGLPEAQRCTLEYFGMKSK